MIPFGKSGLSRRILFAAAVLESRSLTPYISAHYRAKRANTDRLRMFWIQVGKAFPLTASHCRTEHEILVRSDIDMARAALGC